MEHIVFNDKRRARRINGISLIALLMVTVASAQPLVGADERVTGDAEQLDFAHGLFQRSLYEMAITEYKNMIAAHPESSYLGEAHFGIAESLFFSESYKQAITAYKHYLEKFPKGDKTAISKLRIGQSLFLEERYDGALTYFTDIESRELPENLVQILYLYTGKTYKAKDDRFNAFKYFNKVREVAQKSVYTAAAFFEAADMLAGHQMYDQAFGYYAKAYDSAVSDDMKGLALYKQAEMHFFSEKYAAAAEIFKRVIQEYAGHDIAAEALANHILSLFNMEKYQQVIAAYENSRELLAANSKFFNAYYATASAYAAGGQHDASLALLDMMLTLSPLEAEDRHTALLKKAAVLLEAKRFLEVIAVLDLELKEASRDLDRIAFLKAEASYELKRYDEAFTAYKKIVDSFPDSVFADEALYGMAFTKYAAAKDQEAVELFLRYFRQGMDDTRRRQSLYRVLVLEARMGKTEEAIEHCQTFLSTFQEADLNERVMFQLGSLYSKAKDFKNATATFKQFVRSFDASEKLPEAYFLLAYNAQLSDNPEDALTYYEKITLERKDLFYPSLKNTAFIQLEQKDNAAAATTLERIITEFKDNDLRIDIYLWLARYYVDEKKYEAALGILDKAASRKEAKEKRSELAYLKAEAYRLQGEHRKAVKEYDVVLSSTEDQMHTAASRIGKGLCLVAIEDYQSAATEFESAIREYPEDNTVTMRARFEIANIKHKTGDLNEACRFYMLVAVLYQDSRYCPEALYQAGELFEELGKKDEAQKAYQEIIDRYQESQQFKNAKTKLRGFREQ